jgi:Tfp pilus assembly protein PilN
MMITVNLRPGQKRKTGTAQKQLLAKLKELSTRVKEPLLLGAAGAWVVVVVGLVFLYGRTSKDLSTLTPRLEQARADEKRFRGLLDQKRKAEKIRDSLVTQIQVIRHVDGDRYVWPHLLDEVAKALPPYTWLVSVQGTGKATVDTSADSTAARPKVPFSIEGRTVDEQATGQLLRQLEASPWISNVQLVSLSTVAEQGRVIKSFSISADFQEADSAYIRTVPLNQSVR